MKEHHLIIGAGLTGCVLAHQLHALGHHITLADGPFKPISSRVAAGLYNPIIPKRYRIARNAKEIFSFFPHFYSKLESLLHASFFHPAPIYYIHRDQEDQNEWDTYQTNTALSEWIRPYTAPAFPPNIDAPYGATHITEGGWLHISQFIDATHSFFNHSFLFGADPMHPTLGLRLESDHTFTLSNRHFDRVFFCRGERERHFPTLFGALPFRPVRGDIITIESDEPIPQGIWHQGIFMIPLSEKRARVGATYDNNTLNYENNEQHIEEMIQKLKRFYKAPFRVVQKDAGIRPATASRLPIVAEHPIHKGMYIVNGMGSKGVTLAPYYCDLLLQHIFQNQPLPPSLCSPLKQHPFVS